MWCAPVLHVIVKHLTITNKREIKNVSEIDNNETENVSDIEI